MRVWYNQGYSQTRDALLLIRAADPGVTLIASDSRPGAPVLEAADIAIVEPKIARDTPEGVADYVQFCLDFAREQRVDVFIAQRARAALAAARDDFARAGTKLLVAADAATLATIENKGDFYAACAAAGLPTPAFHRVRDVAGFDAALADLAAAGHNACVKPPYGVFGSGYFRLETAARLFPLLQRIDDRVLPVATMRTAIAEMGNEMPELLVMQHLPGPESSIDAVCDSGRMVAATVRTKQGNHQIITGEGPAFDLAARLVSAFGLSNLVNIQVKQAACGTPHVLEINPRMSGGCGWANLAGVNLPWLQLLAATGGLPEVLPRARETRIAVTSTAVLLPAEAENA